MCSDEQHRENLAQLARIEQLLKEHLAGRSVLDQTYYISNSTGFYLDYKNRRHLYLLSAVPLALNLGEQGILFVPASTWTPLDYKEGYELFTINISSKVAVLVRATDSAIPPAPTPLSPAQQQAMIGQAFSVATGDVATGANVAYVGLQLVPVGGVFQKSVWIENAIISTPANACNICQLNQATASTQDSLLTTQLTPQAQEPASGLTSIVAAWASPANTTELVGSLLGTAREYGSVGNDSTLNLLQQSAGVWLPKGSAGSVLLYAKLPTSGNAAALSFDWWEATNG